MSFGGGFPDEHSEERLRARQASCAHPSLRCSLCGVWQDLIYETQQRRIRELEELLAARAAAGVALPGTDEFDLNAAPKTGREADQGGAPLPANAP